MGGQAFAGLTADKGALDEWIALSSGFPDYVQRLGMRLYLEKIRGRQIDISDVRGAYEEVLISLDGEFVEFHSKQSPLERDIVTAISLGFVNTSSIAREARKPITHVSTILARLLNTGS